MFLSDYILLFRDNKSLGLGHQQGLNQDINEDYREQIIPAPVWIFLRISSIHPKEHRRYIYIKALLFTSTHLTGGTRKECQCHCFVMCHSHYLPKSVISHTQYRTRTNSGTDRCHGLVQFFSVKFTTRLSTSTHSRKSKCAVPRLFDVTQCCLWNNFSVDLIGNGPFSSCHTSVLVLTRAFSRPATRPFSSGHTSFSSCHMSFLVLTKALSLHVTCPFSSWQMPTLVLPPVLFLPDKRRPFSSWQKSFSRADKSPFSSWRKSFLVLSPLA